MAVLTERIQHLVVLMLENRSYDLMLGGLRDPKYAGVADGTSLPCDGPLGPNVALRHGVPPDRLAPDPKHNFNDTHAQIYDAPWPSQSTANMRGFARNYYQKQLQDTQLSLEQRRAHLRDFLTIYAEDRLPVLHTLAKQYAVCTHWFSSLPSLTSPNRAFVHAGTTRGEIEQATARWLKLIGDITVFDLLPRSADAWRVYHSGPPHLWIMGDEWILDKKDNFRSFDRFRKDVQAGSLPSYTFIEPRHYGLFEPGSSQHPPQRVSEGERLIASIYDTLISNFGLFMKTAFLIVYDEHGGFYDHVVPPGHPGNAQPGFEVVPPDDKRAPNGFAFNQLGARVPAVLISPWLEAGTTIGWQAPDPALRRTFDHTSILATVDQLQPGAHVLRHSRRAYNAAALNLPTRDQARTPAECSGPLLPRFSSAQYGSASGLRSALSGAAESSADELMAASPEAAQRAELDSGPERELLDLWRERSGNNDWQQLEAHVEKLLGGVAPSRAGGTR